MSEEKELSYSDSIKKASALLTRFPLIPVRGVPLMSHIAINFDSIWAFRPDPSDLLIATYPKAGTDSSTHLQLWGGGAPLQLYLHFLVVHVNTCKFPRDNKVSSILFSSIVLYCIAFYCNKHTQIKKAAYIALTLYRPGIHPIQ